MNPRRWTDDEFVQAVEESHSVAGVLRSLGLQATGANYKTVHLTVERLGLDTSHFTGQSWSRGSSHDRTPSFELKTVLVKNSTYRGKLKQRLLREGLLRPECYLCGIATWLDKPLVLQLDHINGDNRDNRLKNLRLLCPNCHSQTATFCRRK